MMSEYLFDCDGVAGDFALDILSGVFSASPVLGREES